MTQTCECYKKLKYQELCKNLENGQETDQFEKLNDNRTSLLNQREKVVTPPIVIQINDSVFEYPDVRNSDLLHIFPEMAEIITGVEDYEYNILSFWIMDVFIEGLRTAQLAGMSQRNQKATLHWMAYVYNVIQGSGSKMTRRDLFLKIKLLLLFSPNENESAEGEVDEVNDTSWQDFRFWRVPFPPVWRSETDQFTGETAEAESMTRAAEQYETTEPEQDLRDMETIMEIIYRIYARLWSFFLIRTSLRSTPYVDTIDLPVKLNIPKQLWKSESTMQIKSEKGGRRSTARTSEERAIERELKKHDYILPLQAAQGIDEFLQKLFCLPSQESISSEREKAKPDKKKKK